MNGLEQAKQKMFNISNIWVYIVCFILVGIMVWLSWITYMVIDKQINPIDINHSTYGDYVYFYINYAGPSFAEDEAGNKYLFVSSIDYKEEMYQDYLVKVSPEIYNGESLQKIIKTIYDGEKEIAESFRFTGYVREPDQELWELVQKNYQYYNGPQGESDKNPEYYLGLAEFEYSLDTNIFKRLDGVDWFLMAFTTFIIFICTYEISKITKKQGRKNKKIAYTKMLYASDPEYQKAMAEVEQPDTIFFQNCKCWITRNYFISYEEGLDVVSIQNIMEIFGYDETGYSIFAILSIGPWASLTERHYLMVITSDGELHKMAKIAFNARTHSTIVAEMLKRNPDITLGREYLRAYEVGMSPTNIDLIKIKGFYGSNQPWKGRVYETFMV